MDLEDQIQSEQTCFIIVQASADPKATISVSSRRQVRGVLKHEQAHYESTVSTPSGELMSFVR
ncbi:hypothetical protein BCR39DRAFT_543295 [Naematelia encephala]|uniref:Uncharacterized protein n=1 Tax=Naematelia encephala TaxID=71784 RepID=A0A1Y2AUK3_9TREE|nr:hypothetical protein BCR39DRAFT_543295 [Naematelia encephala]